MKPNSPPSPTLSIPGAIAVVLGSSLFILSLLHPIKTLWYLPLARQFHWGSAPTSIAIDFFGRTINAAIFGGIGAMLAHVLLSHIKNTELKGDLALLFGSFALMTVWILAFALSFALGPRVILP